MAFQLRVASDTDIGLVRESNQDMAYAWSKNPVNGTPIAILIVADGIGGYLAGDLASELATVSVAQTIVTFLEDELSHSTQPVENIRARLREAMVQANLNVWRYTKEHLDGEEMGCTLTCMVVQGLEIVIGHVGDSRAYIMYGGTLNQLTVDHTPAGELYEMGEINDQDMLYHPKRHVLTRAVGLSPLIKVDLVSSEVHPEARLLLCTDGLWGYVPEITLERLLSRPGPPRSISRNLIAAANAYGGSDNIGVAICDIYDPDLHRI